MQILVREGQRRLDNGPGVGRAEWRITSKVCKCSSVSKALLVLWKHLEEKRFIKQCPLEELSSRTGTPIRVMIFPIDQSCVCSTESSAYSAVAVISLHVYLPL